MRLVKQSLDTQPVLDPTNSGRVTMDYLMKLVTTARAPPRYASDY